MNNLEAWKLIIEVRYPTASMLFDKRGAIADRWQNDTFLTQWNISSNQVSVHDANHTISLVADINRSIAIKESTGNIHDYINQAKDFTISVFEILNIRTVNRLGLRFIQISKRDHFKLLVNKIKERFYTLTRDDWSVLGGEPDDIALSFTLNLPGGDKANFTCGPMEKKQLEGYFTSKEVMSKLPSVALVVDFDLFRMGPKRVDDLKQGELKNFLENGSKIIQETSSNFLERFEELR